MEERIISLTKEEGAALDQRNRERLEEYRKRYFVTVTVHDKRRKNHYGLNQIGRGFIDKKDAIKWAETVPNRACNKVIVTHNDNVNYYDLAA